MPEYIDRELSIPEDPSNTIVQEKKQANAKFTLEKNEKSESIKELMSPRTQSPRLRYGLSIRKNRPPGSALLRNKRAKRTFP